MKENHKKHYDTPILEVIQFKAQDSIAASGVSLFEEIWSGGENV